MPSCDERHTPASSWSWLFVTHLRQSCISRTVRPRITKFYTNLQIRRIYNHTGYDFTSYFRSEVILKKIRRKSRLRRLRVEFLEKGLIENHEILQAYWDYWIHKPARHYVTSCFRSAAKCTKILLNSQSAQNASGRPKSRIIRPLFNLESPNFARTSMHT